LMLDGYGGLAEHAKNVNCFTFLAARVSGEVRGLSGGRAERRGRKSLASDIKTFVGTCRVFQVDKLPIF